MKQAEILGRLAVIIALTVFATLYTVGIFMPTASAQQTFQEWSDESLRRYERDLQEADKLTALENIAAELHRQRAMGQASTQLVVAVDFEVYNRRYFILWSDGSITDGGIFSSGRIVKKTP